MNHESISQDLSTASTPSGSAWYVTGYIRGYEDRVGVTELLDAPTPSEQALAEAGHLHGRADRAHGRGMAFARSANFTSFQTPIGERS
jgi:hypothetical protein